MSSFSYFMLAPAIAGSLAGGCSSSNTDGAADMLAKSDLGTITAGGGTVQFTASGEVLALGGYGFPPASADDPAFVDGWELKFDELLVTFQNITLSENPDKVPTDQSQVDAPVAQLSGPFAVDLHKGGPLMGKGGADEQAVPIAALMNQNLNGYKPFDPTRRYGFGFDLVPAALGTTNINLDAQAQKDYGLMIASGWTVLYVGTATFKGTGCTSTNPAYDFTKLPKVVKFKLGFASPTTYVNCQNPDNDPADPFGSEEHQRGVQIKRQRHHHRPSHRAHRSPVLGEHPARRTGPLRSARGVREIRWHRCSFVGHHGRSKRGELYRVQRYAAGKCPCPGALA